METGWPFPGSLRGRTLPHPPVDGIRRRCDEHAEPMQRPDNRDGSRDDAKRSGWRVSQQ